MKEERKYSQTINLVMGRYSKKGTQHLENVGKLWGGRKGFFASKKKEERRL